MPISSCTKLFYAVNVHFFIIIIIFELLDSSCLVIIVTMYCLSVLYFSFGLEKEK